MRIQHNITAMNSYRNFSANNSNLSKNLEKLSSGYKINRAGDDAAGLAISEKMRAQITGIEGATKNSKDGISLIQTAEGALTEVHDMLNRMTTLAEQSANGTYQNELDREQLQKEVSQLKEEIDRIADSTNFNGLKLLDGSLSTEATSKSEAAKGDYLMLDAGNNTYTLTKNTQVAAATKNTMQVSDISGDAQITNIVDDTANNNGFTFDARYLDEAGVEQTKTITVDATTKYADADAAAAAIKTAIINADIGFSGGSGSSTAAALTLESKTAGSTGAKLLGITITKHGIDTDGKGGSEYTNPAEITMDDTKFVQGVDEDRSNKIEFSRAFAIGDTLTIGDKTYEIADPTGVNNVHEGNVAIAAGLTSAGVLDQKKTMQNLVNGLVANGVSARMGSTDNSGKTFYVDDLGDISIERDNIDVVIDSDSITSGNASATQSISQFKVAAGAAAETNLTVKYMDADGNEQTRTLKYTGTADAATNATAIKGAIESDDVLKKLFTADTVVGTTANTKDTVRVTSINKGANAPKVLSVVSNDATTNGVIGSTFQQVSEGKDAAAGFVIGADVKSGDTVTVSGKTFEFVKAEDTGKVAKGNNAVVIGSDAKETAKNFNTALQDAGFTTSYVKDTAGVRVVENKFSLAGGSQKNAGGLRLQIGDTSDSFNKLTVSVGDMHAAAIGIGDVDISTQQGASDALDKIKTAINNVSDTRGTLGALQNRLEHTINNLGVQRENIQNAESLIRDTDVAEEMMTYTKNNILNQSAQAMLAQANQLPQGVLQLLQ